MPAIPTNDIRPDPDQPRSEFDEEKLAELAQSMEEQGQAVPITVRRDDVGQDGYVIVAGERRWRAARRLGWDTIRADVRDVGREEAEWLALIENIQREDLSPVEEARAYKQQLAQHDLTQTELAEKLGKSQSYVAQKLRLLDLPAPIMYWIESGALSQSHVRQLLRLKGVFLEGAELTYRNRALEEICEVDNAHRFVMAERPTDWPLYYLDPEEEEKQAVLHSAVKRYFASVAEQDHTIAAWKRTAWFFGAVAFCKDMSVAALSEAIDRFEQRVRSHYITVAGCQATEAFSEAPRPTYEFEEEVPPAPEDGTPVSELTREEVETVLWRMSYWGAEGDLHHAGLLGALRETDRTIPGGETEASKDEGGADLSESEIEANQDILTESVNRSSDPSHPTMMVHPNAPEHQKWEELEARLAELES